MSTGRKAGVPNEAFRVLQAHQLLKTRQTQKMIPLIWRTNMDHRPVLLTLEFWFSLVSGALVMEAM